jgi:hypothetical protein
MSVRNRLRAIINASRGHADYWEWPRNRPGGEVNAARILYNFLSLSDDQIRGKLSPVSSDPPDVLLCTDAGRRIGIEDTELVDPDAIKATKLQKKQGLSVQELWPVWTLHEMAQMLTARIQLKDAKLSRVVTEYDELWLVIKTDEGMITEAFAASAIKQLIVSVKHLSKAYLLVGYHPSSDKSKYPDGCAVIPIALDRH